MVDTVILKATQSGNLSYFQQNVKFKDTKAAMLQYFYKKSGDTLTHIACRFGHTHILSLLSDEGFSLEAENFDGKTALHEAAQATNFECVEFLIHAGANVDALKRADWTPLMLACTKDNVEVISLLLKNGANPSLINKDGWNSFHIAAREGHMSVIRELLQHNASLWDTVSKNGRTPLHTAVLHGHKEVVEFMLENCGYETDMSDSCGTTPLMDALRVQNTEIARLLIDKHKAKFSKEDNLGQQAIHQAAQAGAIESLKLLVKECGVDPSVSSSVQGVTPLHVAAKEGQLDAMLFLLSMGAELNKCDNKGRTANVVPKTDIDVSKMWCSMSEFPLRFGQPPSSTPPESRGGSANKSLLSWGVNHRDVHAYLQLFALHIAAGAQHAKSVNVLLQHGAQSLPDASGTSPSMLARKQDVKHVFDQHMLIT